MKSKYAIKALVRMAVTDGENLNSKKIAELENIPAKFLDNILQTLRTEGVVASKRGIFGGYYLQRKASEIRLGDVVRLFDGPLAPIACASQTAYQRCDDCADEAACAVHKIMVDVRNAIARVLDGKTLGELAASPNRNDLFRDQ
jgi:Rrf2 family protein